MTPYEDGQELAYFGIAKQCKHFPGTQAYKEWMAGYESVIPPTTTVTVITPNKPILVNILERIKSITDTLPINFLHLTEEVGELATEVIIETGTSYKGTDEGVAAEAVDVIVCALAILANKFYTAEEMELFLLNYLDKKVKKWETNYLKDK